MSITSMWRHFLESIFQNRYEFLLGSAVNALVILINKQVFHFIHVKWLSYNLQQLLSSEASFTMAMYPRVTQDSPENRVFLNPEPDKLTNAGRSIVEAIKPSQLTRATFSSSGCTFIDR